MKSIFPSLAVALVLSAPVYAAETVDLKTEEQKLSYSIGVDIGSAFSQQNVPIDEQALQQGIVDSLQGKQLQLTEEQMENIIRDFQENLIEERMEQFSELAGENMTEGTTFLDGHQQQEGVVVLDSGLQYRVIKTGDGVQPAAEDQVTVAYEGRLISGEVFDSSKEHGDSVSLKLNQVIQGWQEALQLMKEGDVWEVVIPANLAYGDQGFGIIGPNETLVFEIELISVDKE